MVVCGGPGEIRGLFVCAPGKAHSLGGASHLRTLMTGTVSLTAKASGLIGVVQGSSKSQARVFGVTYLPNIGFGLPAIVCSFVLSSDNSLIFYEYDKPKIMYRPGQFRLMTTICFF